MIRKLIQILIALKAIESALDRIQQKGQAVMATFENFKATLAEIDAETTRIADKISDLLGQIDSGNLSAEQEAEAHADILAHLERLKGIGADPENPVPDPVA